MLTLMNDEFIHLSTLVPGQLEEYYLGCLMNGLSVHLGEFLIWDPKDLETAMQMARTLRG